MEPRTAQEPIAKTLAKGAAAGLVATGALVGVRDALWQLESDALREREKDLREGAEATGLQKPVRAIAEQAGVPLDKTRERQIGKTLAWGMGVGGVVAYSAARRKWPQLRAGGGVAFGLGMWLLEDELLMPITGMARPPQDYPWQAHARGLAAHTAYGVAAETTLRALDRAF